MNGSDSLLDQPLTSAVTGASFQLVRRGYDPLEVQAFARAVSAELQRLGLENQELRARVASGFGPTVQAAQAAPQTTELDDSSVAKFLGSEDDPAPPGGP